MECFMSLASLAERETTLVPISKTQQVEILCGQCMVDNTQLAKLWDKDRKTVPKLLQAMEAVGISSSQKVGDNRIIASIIRRKGRWAESWKGSWHQRLKTPERNCTHNLHKSRQSLFLHPLLLRLAQFVLSFRLKQHHNQRRNLKLHKLHSQSTLAMKSKRCGFRALSKMSFLMRFRFQRIMI